MSFELQPRIENQWIKLEPLEPSDFEALYAGEIVMAYYGEESRPNVIYEIGKSDWSQRGVRELDSKELDSKEMDGSEITERALP